MQNNQNKGGNPHQEPDSAALWEALKAARVKVSDIIPTPKIALEQTRADGRRAIIGTLGNFSVIIGKAKSRKSFSVAIATAAALGGTSNIGGITGKLPEGKRRVLYFDTEQHPYHVQMAAHRIAHLAGHPKKDLDTLEVYALRPYAPAMRTKLINEAINNTPNIGLVIIDGIRDLINDINSPQEATDISTALLSWTQEKDIHIITVLHQNKGNEHARGHLGTEMINKAEMVLVVERNENDPNISEVRAAEAKNIEPDPFYFEIGSEAPGIPMEVENAEFRTTPAKLISPDKLDHSRINALLNRVFEKEKTLDGAELETMIQWGFEVSFGATIGVNKARSLKRRLKIEGYINGVQEGKKIMYTWNEGHDPIRAFLKDTLKDTPVKLSDEIDDPQQDDETIF
jgi:hypothetical protein